MSRSYRRFLSPRPWACLVACALTALATADSPFATAVASYAPGIGPAAGFTNPAVALGSPERFTGEGLIPQAVTPFQPAFRPDEVVSIGMGGSLVLAFDHDVVDDPRNPFGIDLLLFGNAFFGDMAAPAGVVGGLFAEGGTIAVSPDGVTWTLVPSIAADGAFPTLGWLDTTPYATTPGTAPTDFTRPVDPALRRAGMVGLDWSALLLAYDGSGGGAGIDLATIGLASIRYVRIDGPTTFGISPEVDAVSDVAPASPSPDLDGDGSVGASDLALLLGAWGTAGPAADLDGDGAVGASDLALLLGAWA